MKMLIIEDDYYLRANLKQALTKAGFVADAAKDGSEAELLTSVNDYQLVVLDLGLPGIDGLQLLRKWRKSGKNFKVLILTARSSWSDKVSGLDLGADDYMVKPFKVQELLARIRALIRRDFGHTTADLEVGRFRLNQAQKTIFLDDKALQLTAKEYTLLAYLMLNAGKVVARSTIQEQLYGFEEAVESNTLEVFIRRLRRKVGKNQIATVRNLGYCLQPV